MSDTGESSGRRPKVVRLLDEYGLGSLGDELERRWTAEGDDRMSLRALADYFNKQLLATAMAEVGLQPLDGEVDNVYRLLTGDVSGADRTRTERRLEREGVDVEGLRSDFLTYQAIRTYLKEYRGAEYATDDRERTVVEAENIGRLRGRTAVVVESKIDQLRDAGHLEIGDPQTFVEVRVLCADCGGQYEIDELLDRGHCDCQPESEP
ncbi:rod-determining factor RdfA [Halorarius litoreus]|uniref:rod-determining factor RdfA n=1 Tax=Halorarius litoreus TaxID=2962676 RepID=UPI0020CD5989|nr:rod-determining factor RdfA [Halorarius litoreus]